MEGIVIVEYVTEVKMVISLIQCALIRDMETNRGMALSH